MVAWSKFNAARSGRHILIGEFMSEFTFLFRGREYFTSPSEGQKHMEQWVAWFKDLGAQGRLKDAGHPLEKSGQVVMGKDKLVKDGPYAEAKDIIGGYSIVEAENLGHAVELAKGCPILAVGGSVEVRPLLKF
jgi:hypothetical protein